MQYCSSKIIRNFQFVLSYDVVVLSNKVIVLSYEVVTQSELKGKFF